METSVSSVIGLKEAAMKAAEMVDPFKIEIIEVDDLEYGPGDILIKTAYAGICGSDIHAFKGDHPFRKPPVVLGHEISGAISKIGTEVEGFNIDDPVTVMPYQWCGDCISCRNSRYNICRNRRMPGMGEWVGTFAEYFLSKPSITFKLNTNTSRKLGVLAEPLATAIHSIRQAKLKPGNDIAILGAGPIGLFTGLAARETGAATIAITDLFDYNLSTAVDLFDALAYNAQTENVQEKIINDRPDRYDVVCLCGNAPVMIDQALNIIKPGGRIVVTGMFLKPTMMPLIDITLREIEIIGTQIYDQADFLKALDLLDSGKYDFNRFISHTLPMDKAQEAMHLVLDPNENTAKVLLEN